MHPARSNLRALIPLILLAAAASPAMADPNGTATAAPPAEPSTAITAAVVAEDGRSLLLVGRSGQLYRPGAAGSWQRSGLGGVAADVTGAVRPSGGPLFAAGRRSPIYRFEAGAWHAMPLPHRGRVVMPAATSAAVLAIGRHILIWNGTRWQRLIGTRTPVTALWASAGRTKQGHNSPAWLYVATEAGRLQRIAPRTGGSTWQVLNNPLGAREPIIALAGARGGDGRMPIYAIGQSGSVLEVIGRRSRALPVTPQSAALTPHVAAVDSAGGVVIAGLLRGPDQDETAVIIRARRGQPSAVETLAEAAGQRFTLLHTTPDDGLLLATSGGGLRLRAGTVWREGQVTDGPPPPRTGPDSAPARTR